MNLYGISNRPTIEETPFLVGDRASTMGYCYANDLKFVTCTEVRGYMNDELSTLHHYDGRYGTGVVRTKPCFYHGRRSTTYMTIEYWVKEEE